jgi:hypothetical protein
MVFGVSKPDVMSTDETLGHVLLLDVATTSVMTAAIAIGKVMVLDLSTADVTECL